MRQRLILTTANQLEVGIDSRRGGVAYHPSPYLIISVGVVISEMELSKIE